MNDSTATIGLLADPGVPERVAARIAPDVAERVSRETGEPWTVEVSEETLPLTPEGTIDLSFHAPRLRRRHGWEYVVYLSDLPRYVEGRPMISEVTAEAHAALIPVPVLGALRLAARARDLVVALVRTTMAGTDARPATPAVAAALGRTVVQSPSPPGASASSDPVTLVVTARTARVRLLSGMVRSNRPGRLLPALTGGIAAAVATGSFGIFYGSLAPVADALPLWRLGLVSVLVTTVLTTWLIIRNHLWNSERGQDKIWQQSLDNASTVITVGLTVVLLYGLLSAAMLILALVVLDPGYLQSELRQEVGAPEYIKLAWLSASMGTLAGALGANFDSQDAVREATFSLRYHERRNLFDTYEQSE